MSAVYDKTWDLFMAASLSDDDLGYPAGQSTRRAAHPAPMPA
jgi:hypothetical protein